jgi:calcium-dependent protein kinase
MGNCTTRENDIEGEDSSHTGQTMDLKIKHLRDPVLELLEQYVPKNLVRPIAHFKATYTTKKNFLCQKDVFYKIQLIENIRSRRLFLLKTIKKADIEAIGFEVFKNSFVNELKSLETFKHPNTESIVSVYWEQFQDDVRISLITPYTTKISLYDFMNSYIAERKRLDDKDIIIIMKLLAETLYKMKTNNVIHRNISPESIYFGKEENYYSLTIRNFYFSIITAGTAKGSYGPLWYMAPEMLKDLEYDCKVDVWSLGVIFYMLLTLENPFKDKMTKEDVLDTIRNNKGLRTQKELAKLGYNVECLKLISKMLEEDPSKRINIEAVFDEKLFKEHLDKNENIQKMYKDYFDIFEKKDMLVLSYKVENVKELHEIVFFLVYNLRDYFINVEELAIINEFFKYLDINNDGQIELKEIKETLRNNKFTEDKINIYTDLIFKVIKTNFRAKFVKSYLQDSIDYDYFLVANIIIGLIANKYNIETKKKVEIIFKELDEDGSQSISIEEIKNSFTTKYPINVRAYMNNIKRNPWFTGKIKDFENLTLEDLYDLITFDCVTLTDTQITELDMDQNKTKEVKSMLDR